MDDGSPIGYLLLILFLLLGGGFFAGTEIALASVSRIRMMSYADDGNRRAQRVLDVLDDFDRALTTLLIGNNIMHIGCASVTTLLATRLWGNGAVAAVTFATTLVVFLVAEMIPKAYAKACNERFAMSVAGPLLFLMKVLTPVSFFFTLLGNAVKKMFRMQETEEPTVTEEEISDILDTIGDEGEFDEDTSELMQSALQFTKRTVNDIVTGKDALVTVSRDMPIPQILQIVHDTVFSRLPVLDSSGKICGILQIRRFLNEYLRLGEKMKLIRVTDRVFRVSGDLPIDEALNLMSSRKVHMAVVVCADGSEPGIVTIEDMVEELVGEIYDEQDREVKENA